LLSLPSLKGKERKGKEKKKNQPTSRLSLNFFFFWESYSLFKSNGESPLKYTHFDLLKNNIYQALGRRRK
jgi:hypothetical protein